MDKARDELRNSNISLSKGAEGLAKAEITPQGELLIDGRPVATNPAQKMLLKDYRQSLIAVAESGMDIGTQGADIAGKAMGHAVKGIFSGMSEEEIEQSMAAESEAIEAAAQQLCDKLPALLASERQLAAALPEFAPYATMDEGDIDDCNGSQDGAATKVGRAELREEIRSGIRDGVRNSIRAVAQSSRLATNDSPADQTGGKATTTTDQEAAPSR
ncbi:DUF2884 family protein [Luteimonas vadosa]